VNENFFSISQNLLQYLRIFFLRGPPQKSDPGRCLIPHILHFSHSYPGRASTHVHDLADTAQARTAWKRGVGIFSKSKKNLRNFFSGASPEIRPRKVPKTPYSTITQGEHRTHVHDLADTAQARTAWQRGVGNSPKSKKTQNFFLRGGPPEIRPRKVPKTPYSTTSHIFPPTTSPRCTTRLRYHSFARAFSVDLGVLWGGRGVEKATCMVTLDMVTVSPQNHPKPDFFREYFPGTLK
jgi:hypothetical protein